MDCEGFLISLHRILWLDRGFIFSHERKTLKLKIFSEYGKRKKKKGLNGETKVIFSSMPPLSIHMACDLIQPGASKRAYSGPSLWYIINKKLKIIFIFNTIYFYVLKIFLIKIKKNYLF
jgi:hypothetical protein